MANTAATKRAGPQTAGHSHQDQEQSDASGGVNQDVGQMMSAGPRPIGFAVQHVRHPGHGMPVRGITMGKGPNDSLDRHSASDVRVLVDVIWGRPNSRNRASPSDRRPVRPPRRAVRRRPRLAVLGQSGGAVSALGRMIDSANHLVRAAGRRQIGSRSSPHPVTPLWRRHRVRSRNFPCFYSNRKRGPRNRCCARISTGYRCQAA